MSSLNFPEAMRVYLLLRKSGLTSDQLSKHTTSSLIDLLLEKLSPMEFSSILAIVSKKSVNELANLSKKEIIKLLISGINSVDIINLFKVFDRIVHVA